MARMVLAPAACHLAFRLARNRRIQQIDKRRRAEEKYQRPGDGMACETDELARHVGRIISLQDDRMFLSPAIRP
jgi:hypothetical protein